MPKVAIISQPKAGTYLCVNLLQNFGLRFSNIHAREHNYTIVNSDINYQRLNLRKQKVKSSLVNTINRIPNNGFFVSHLVHTENTEMCLSAFKKILLMRDLKSCKESWKSWAKVTGKSVDSAMLDKNFRQNIEKWKDKENVFPMHFNDMKQTNPEVLDNLQIFLFGDIFFNSVQTMQNALDRDSLTKRVF